MWDSFRFFQSVPVTEFLFGTQWSPQVAIRADQVGSSGAFGAVPLFAGTLLIMMIAMAVAAPIGLMSAIYLSEYAGSHTRAVVKPMLEILAGVPTVVYGFFAALTVGPLLRVFFNEIGLFLIGGPLDGLGQYLALVQNQMALTAGAVMGIMLIPFVSSLSDDILNAVPQSLRDGSFAMGATKSETVKRVLLPAALPGGEMSDFARYLWDASERWPWLPPEMLLDLQTTALAETARARGRADLLRKRTSHVTIILEEK